MFAISYILLIYSIHSGQWVFFVSNLLNLVVLLSFPAAKEHKGTSSGDNENGSDPNRCPSQVPVDKPPLSKSLLVGDDDDASPEIVAEVPFVDPVPV